MVVSSLGSYFLLKHCMPLKIIKVLFGENPKLRRRWRARTVGFSNKTL